MDVAIVGAGAMGTLIGHGVCASSHHLTVVDLPQRLQQIDQAGLHVIDLEGNSSQRHPDRLTDNVADLDAPDLVILATKAQVLPDLAAPLGRVLGPNSLLLPIQNGIPWWYLYRFHTEQHQLDARVLHQPALHCLDPQNKLDQHIDPRQVIGCVAYPAANLAADGAVTHVEGWNFPVGELNGATTPRIEAVSAVLQESGFKSRIIDDIRSEMWLKCWGALSINPVSALTRATMEDICDCNETQALIRQMMGEAQQVAELYGARFRHTIDKRIAGARAVGAHKTSMLQDVEAGRALELDALMQAVLELADRINVATPTLRSVYACMVLLNQGLNKSTVASTPRPQKIQQVG